MEDARRGLIAMNRALQDESLRRKNSLASDKTAPQEKQETEKEIQNGTEEEVEQLDISDRAAVSAVHPEMTAVPPSPNAIMATATGAPATPESNETDHATAKVDTDAPILLQSATLVTKESASETVQTSKSNAGVTVVATAAVGTTPRVAMNAVAPIEKTVEKRTSIIEAMSSIFSSSKPNKENPNKSIIAAVSTSGTVMEEEDVGEAAVDVADDEEDDEDEESHAQRMAKEREARLEREKLCSQRIELDLGTGEMSLGLAF